jgi:hypothetical protein
MRFGRSEVQSNVVAVFILHSDVRAASGACAEEKATQPLSKATNGRTFAIAMTALRVRSQGNATGNSLKAVQRHANRNLKINTLNALGVYVAARAAACLRANIVSPERLTSTQGTASRSSFANV